MRQRLVSTRYPYIHLYVNVQARRTILQFETDALLDTGFSGDLAVPEERFKDIRHGPDAYASLRLADGSSTLAPVYQGSVSAPEFDSDVHVSFNVTIIAMGDEVLVGRGFLDRFLVTFDHGRRVIIEP